MKESTALLDSDCMTDLRVWLIKRLYFCELYTASIFLFYFIFSISTLKSVIYRLIYC